MYCLIFTLNTNTMKKRQVATTEAKMSPFVVAPNTSDSPDIEIFCITSTQHFKQQQKM
jgi:hypothetical protein